MRKFILSSAILLLIASITIISCKKTKNPDPVTPDPNTMTDSRDGKVYKTVTIGTQTWMGENLNYQGNTLAPGTFSCYDSLSANCSTYGTLYNYNAALLASPAGWHLPTDTEWKTLEEYLGMSSAEADAIDLWRGAGTGVEVGTKLKAGGSTNLNLLFGGFYQTEPNNNGYAAKTLAGSFWSATSGIAPGDTAAYLRRVITTETGVFRSLYYKSSQNSIRCIRN